MADTAPAPAPAVTGTAGTCQVARSRDPSAPRTRCGQPATRRVTASCACHGAAGILMCEDCWAITRKGPVWCWPAFTEAGSHCPVTYTDTDRW